MKINYKLIESERVEDAPFIGALISAIDCNFNCKSCFNQSVKDLPTQSQTAEYIVDIIKSNLFNQGLIFGGLEWTLQPEELIELAKVAKDNGLETMLYTGNTFYYMVNNYENNNLRYFDYIKCGQYIKSLETNDNVQYGIKLATSNQHIYKKDIDY